MTTDKPVRYELYQHGKFVRPYKTRLAASSAADRADAAYGAVCCTVKPIWED